MEPKDLLFGPQEITLPGGLVCLVSINPKGLCCPNVSDEVSVYAFMCLPTQDGYDSLHQDLRFDKRLGIFGEPLSSNWGLRIDLNKARWKMDEKSISAATWMQAITKAHEYVMGEVDKLRAALQLREDALRSEGHELIAAHHLHNAARS